MLNLRTLIGKKTAGKSAAFRLHENLRRDAGNSLSLVQSDQVLGNDQSSIKVIGYPETFSGVINSFIDRFPFDEKLFNQINGEWSKYKSYLRVKPPTEKQIKK